MKTNWYSITAKADKTAEILIYEQIGEDFFGDGVSAKGFATELKALGDLDEITVRINSPGGDVFDGNAIFNILRAHKAKIIVAIDGIAASIASVIAMAGDKIIMPENAMMMIHDPSGFAMGTADEMRKMSDALDKIKTSLVAAYSGKANIDDAQIIDMMTDETWLTAAEAVEMGFADEVAEPVRLAANFDLSMFKHPPQNLTSGVNSPASINAGISGKPPSQQEDNSMTEITREIIAEKHPEIANHFRNEGRDVIVSDISNHASVIALVETARVEGAKAEHTRIADVEAVLIPGHEALIAEMVADGKTTGAEAAIRIVAAENIARQAQLDKLKADGKGVANINNATPDNVVKIDQNLPLEERCKAEWDADPKIRAEFSGGLESYIACVKAEENGQVKVRG